MHTYVCTHIPRQGLQPYQKACHDEADDTLTCSNSVSCSQRDICMCLAFSTQLDDTLPAALLEYTDVSCHAFFHSLRVCLWGHFRTVLSSPLFEVLLWQLPAMSQHLMQPS